MVQSIQIDGFASALETYTQAETILSECFFTARRVSSKGTDLIPDGRISRVNLNRVCSFDLLSDGTVYVWTTDGDGYEVISQWMINQIKEDCKH